MKSMKKIFFILLLLTFCTRLFSLPGDKLESVLVPKEDLFSLGGPRPGGPDCISYRKEGEVSKFSKIINYLGCNIIKRPIDFCVCLDRLSSPPSSIRGFSKEIISSLSPENISDLEALKKKKKKFISELDGEEKKRKSFEFDHIYCMALKDQKKQINRNIQLAISLMGKLESIDEKRQALKEKDRKIKGTIRDNKMELKKLKDLFKKKKISEEEYLDKKYKLEKDNISLVKSVKKICEDRKDLWELFQANAHQLKITSPLPAEILINGIERERKKHLNKDLPKREREYFYELVYILGERGDDKSIDQLKKLITDKKYKISPKETEFRRVVVALGIGRNPIGFKALEDILKNDKRVLDYQIPSIQKSLGLMLGKDEKTLTKKLEEFKNLEGKEKEDLLAVLTYVKDPRVNDILSKIKEEPEKRSDYLETLIHKGILRNSSTSIDEHVENMMNINPNSPNALGRKINLAESLIDVGRYDLLVKMIEKNEKELKKDDTYIHSLLETTIEKINQNSRYISAEERKKISKALRSLEKTSDKKIAQKAKKSLLNIGDLEEINKVREMLKDKKEMALKDMQYIRARNKYTQQEVIKDYRKAIKEEEKPKKNESKKEKKERLERVSQMKKSFLGQTDILQKEAISKANETKLGKKLESLGGREADDGEFFSGFDPQRPKTIKRLGIEVEKEEPPLEVSKEETPPKKEKIDKEIKETVRKAFSPVESKISRSLLLPPKPLKPIVSYGKKYQVKKDISKLENQVTERKEALAASFGSKQGESFWKNNNVEDRLRDSKREAFRQKDQVAKDSPKEIKREKTQSKRSSDDYSGPSGEPPMIAPKKSRGFSSRPSFVPTDSSLLPGSKTISQPTSEEVDYSPRSETKISLTSSDLEDDKVKVEKYRILLIRKAKESDKGGFKVPEKFLSLSLKERRVILERLFIKTKEKNLLLKTPSGVLIRVQRDITYKKKPEKVVHEKREILASSIVKKEKRIDGLYSKLKSFLKRSKRKNK